MSEPIHAEIFSPVHMAGNEPATHLVSPWYGDKTLERSDRPPYEYQSQRIRRWSQRDSNSQLIRARDSFSQLLLWPQVAFVTHSVYALYTECVLTTCFASLPVPRIIAQQTWVLTRLWWELSSHPPSAYGSFFFYAEVPRWLFQPQAIRN